MKKNFTIFLAFLILGSTIHLDELVKIPFLIHHIIEHKTLHPNESFFAIFISHYLSNKQAESAKDKKSDSNLPYKNPHSAQSHYDIFVVEAATLKFAVPMQTGYISTLNDSNISSVFFDIWLPPKVA